MKHIHVFLSGVLFFGAVSPLAGQTQLDLDLGFQTRDLSGNKDVYRSHLNEDEGFLLKTLAYRDSGGAAFDHLELEISGFGASPRGRLDMKMSKGDLFRLDVDYLYAEHFSAVPGLANPFLADGIIPGQHTRDRERQVLDVEMSFLESNIVSPMVGFRWNSYNGPSRTTYHLGEDEYQLQSQIDEREWEIWAGARFDNGATHAELTQGWRDFDGSENQNLLFGAEQGNNDRPFLGHDQYLDTYTSRSQTDSETPVTRLTVTSRLNPRVDLLADFVYADLESTLSSDETYAGSLTSFQINRFFGGGSESIQSRTESPSWRGNLRLEVLLPRDIDLSLGYEKSDREHDGVALITTLFLDSVTFSNADPEDYLTVIDARPHLDREQDVLEAKVTANELGDFKLWASWSLFDEQTTLSEDLAQIVLPDGQQGRFDRQVEDVRIGAGYHAGATHASIEYRNEDADSAVVRTDFLERETLTVRVRTAIAGAFHLSAHAKQLEAENPLAGIDYELELDTFGIDADVTMGESFSAVLSYSVFDLTSALVYRDPLFVSRTSSYVEDGDNLSLGLHWTGERLSLEGWGSTYDNTGAVAYTYERYGVRAGWRVNEQLRASIEARNDSYEEEALPVADYDVDTYAFIIGWRR
jgi:hypothetical protein